MTETKGRILVIRGGAIGDFILTLPALAALRRQFPRAHIELLGYPHIAQLAHAGRFVDRVQSIEARALAGYFATGGDLDPDLAEYFQSFHLVLSYLYDPDEIFRTNLRRSTTAQFLTGPHRPDESQPLHATDVFLQPLERLAVFDADPVPRLDLESLEDKQLSAHSWLAVHPGSGSELKNWPLPAWTQFLEQIVRQTQLRLLLIGGEAEHGRIETLAARFPAERVRLAQELSLLELARLLKETQFFMGHDSGITHLAAALGLPGLVLWGTSNPDIWRPRHEKMVVLKYAGGLERLPAAVVLGQFQQLMARFA